MKRPWNIVDVPVYSLATYDRTGVNMNICTYVSAVSMQPKMYMLAIDYKSKTFQNLTQSNYAILQVLHQTHADLVPMLGKKSGAKINKQQKLERKNLLTTWNGRTVLENTCAYIALTVSKRSNIDGDHELFFCDVKKSTTKREDEILMFQDLVAQGIIL